MADCKFNHRVPLADAAVSQVGVGEIDAVIVWPGKRIQPFDGVKLIPFARAVVLPVIAVLYILDHCIDV
jgi:hypothetical protein